MFGFDPRLTKYFLLPIENSISTNKSFSLIVLMSWSFLILRNGLLNKAKHRASSIVLLPEPFSPTISVLGDSLSLISVQEFPVESKFFHRTILNSIILYLMIQRIGLQYTGFSLNCQAFSCLLSWSCYLCICSKSSAYLRLH